MKLVFIRHGATRSNEYKKYIGGRTEEPLSEKGKREISEAKAEGKYPPVQLAASSPMRRCLETAELIYGQSPVIVIDEWREIDFGSFEGKDYKELGGDIYYRKWIESGGTLPFLHGESREGFAERCGRGFVKFLRATAKSGNRMDTAAAIVHGGTIMALLSTFGEGGYYDFQCRNGEGFSCEIHEEFYKESNIKLYEKYYEKFRGKDYEELHEKNYEAGKMKIKNIQKL